MIYITLDSIIFIIDIFFPDIAWKDYISSTSIFYIRRIIWILVTRIWIFSIPVVTNNVYFYCYCSISGEDFISLSILVN